MRAAQSSSMSTKRLARSRSWAEVVSHDAARNGCNVLRPRPGYLCILIEFHDTAIRRFLEWMPNNDASLVVLDLDRAWPFFAAVISPSQIARQDILRPLQPLKADDCRCSCFGLTTFDAAPGKRVGLVSRGRGLRPHSV
jgi:hypothetical protein